MNTVDFEQTLDAHFARRAVRAGLGMAATGVFLVGYLVQPQWVFVLSVLSIYMTITAILGVGLSDAFKPARSRLEPGTMHPSQTAKVAAPDMYKEAA